MTRFEHPISTIPFHFRWSVSTVSICLVLIALSLALWSFRLRNNQVQSLKVPKLFSVNSTPVTGAWGFLTQRYTWYQKAVKASIYGNFSFWVGPYMFVGLSGLESRQVFLQNPGLDISQGYAVLFGAGPQLRNDEGDDIASSQGFVRKFNAYVVHLLRPDNMDKNLGDLINDVQTGLDQIGPVGLINPFVDIYNIVFQMTTRMFGCTEIVDNKKKLAQTLNLYQTIAQSSSLTNVFFPWMPTFAWMRRTVAGARLYFKIKHIIDERSKTGRREDDALQYYIDEGNDAQIIIQIVISALFAAQVNSGFSVAYLLAHIGSSPYWYQQVRAEVDHVLIKYAPDRSLPLTQRFNAVPLKAWESEFPLLNCCLKDSVRLQMSGTMFRRNIGGKDIAIGNEIIPKGAYVTYQFSDVHQDPAIYPEPLKWDPNRYTQERGEDKKVPSSWLPFGGGRHPCLGYRLAQLEHLIIVSLFLMRFEYETCDDRGSPLSAIPPPDLNEGAAAAPKSPVLLKYRPREEKIEAAAQTFS